MSWMMFIWIIGSMAALGIAAADDADEHTSWPLILLACFVGWPMIFGAKVLYRKPNSED